MLAADKLSPQLAYFNQKPSEERQNFEKATPAYLEEHATKGKLALSALRTPSIVKILTCDTALEYMCLWLILSDRLSATDVET